MSLLTKLIVEAERASVVEFMQELERDEGLRTIMREKGVQAAMQAVTTRPAGIRMRPNSPNRRPNGPGEAGPVRVGGGDAGNPRAGSARAGGAFPHGAGAPISHNSTPGRPDVTVVGRARPSTMAHPIRSAKSKIVPEPRARRHTRPLDSQFRCSDQVGSDPAQGGRPRIISTPRVPGERHRA
jgi:hypothetical protein